jgi:deoxyribodipyrimidine photo-lyase
MPRHTTSIVWFRRDLRLNDHVALQRAATDSERVVCAFVLDPVLLRGPHIGAPIVSVFFDSLAELRARLRERGSDLALLEGDALPELRALARRTATTALYYNLDYEPHARERDERVAGGFRADGAHVAASIDHVYYGADEACKPDGSPYTVFTPYKRRWLERRESDPRPPVPSLAAVERKLARAEAIGSTRDVPAPEDYGHARSPQYPRGGEANARRILDAFVSSGIGAYAERRNEPAVDGTSRLSPHLRAGTIGIRTCVAAAAQARSAARGTAAAGADTWTSELIWREFYQQILAHYPHVAREPFVPAARRLEFRDSQSDFEAWSQARTGYPIVDAALVQLNTTGWMHNRLRMIVASFLTKHLLLDYRLGERYFEQRLADADLAANNGGWQWTASTGTDAAPYFRIFNPVLQSQKFDPNGDFIRSMLPALSNLDASAIHAPWLMPPLAAAAAGIRLGHDYPPPIVDHRLARERALAAYAPVFRLPRRD